MVNAVKIKRQQAGVLAAERTESRTFRQLLFRQRGQTAAPVFRLRDIRLLQPLQRRAQANHPGDIGRPGLEAPGGGLGFEAVEGDFGNHFSPAEPRRHLRQPFAFAIQRADAGRPVELMAGKSIKVDIQRLDVRREMHRPLRAVDHHHHPGSASLANRQRQVRAAAGDVGHLANRQHPTARRDERAKRRYVRQTVARQRQLHHPRAGLLCNH